MGVLCGMLATLHKGHLLTNQQDMNGGAPYGLDKTWSGSRPSGVVRQTQQCACRGSCRGEQGGLLFVLGGALCTIILACPFHRGQAQGEQLLLECLDSQPCSRVT